MITQTGYPSKDKPWLKYYSQEAIGTIVPDGSMYDVIKNSNKDRLNCIAIDYFDNKITYGEFFYNVELNARCLAARGICAGSVVSIISLNTPETLYLIYALSCIGAVANMLIATSSKQEIVEHIKNTDSKMVFVLDKFTEKYKRLMQISQ